MTTSNTFNTGMTKLGALTMIVLFLTLIYLGYKNPPVTSSPKHLWELNMILGSILGFFPAALALFKKNISFGKRSNTLLCGGVIWMTCFGIGFFLYLKMC